MVTKGVALALALEEDVIMLPGWIRMGPVLPFTGERIRVNSRLRRAASAVALASRIGGFGIVHILRRNGVLALQAGVAVELGLGGGQRGGRIVIGRLIGARVDLEKRIAGLDHLAFAEEGLGELAGDAGIHRHGGIGHHGADGALDHGHGALFDGGGAHGRGDIAARRRGGGMGEVPESAQGDDERGAADQVLRAGAAMRSSLWTCATFGGLTCTFIVSTNPDNRALAAFGCGGQTKLSFTSSSPPCWVADRRRWPSGALVPLLAGGPVRLLRYLYALIGEKPLKIVPEISKDKLS